MREKIVIVKKDGSIVCYKDNEFTEYEYLNRLFIVKRNTQWIGIYNTDCIDNIRVVNDD